MTNHICYISLDTIHKIGTLFFGTITVILAILGYRKFLQNKLRDKQLDVICDLIKQIQQIDFHYIFFNTPNNSQSGVATLFDIAEMKEFDDYERWYYFAASIEDINEQTLNWDFFYKFYSHPLIPKSIATILKKFTLRNRHAISYRDIKNSKCIILGRKGVIGDDTRCLYIKDDDMGTCKSFKKAAKELKDDIIKWANRYKINDLNITTSHI
jgi:hypothetical protein